VKNPFKYGELIQDAAFCNRRVEIKRIHQAFKDAQSLILISPRRWGKSSLIDVAVDRYKGKHRVAKLDCFGITSEEQFLETYLKIILKASHTQLQDFTATAKKFISAIIPYLSFSIGDNDEVKVSLQLKGNPVDLDVVLDLPQKIAREKGIRFVVCIDEFQKIHDWPTGKAMLEKLRSCWQRHPDVCYCLYGSKRHLMANLFSDSSQPFYKFGETIFLNKIEREEWTQFLVDQFQATGKTISAEVAGMIVDRTRRHSYYVQYFARLCWSEAGSVVTPQHMENAWSNLLNDHLPLFRQTAANLTTYQVNYIRAFCAGEKQFSSQRVMRDYNLGSPGNIQRIEKTLEDQEIMNFFADEQELAEPYFEPLFRRYFL
jgi:uncharacterized protein